MDSLKKELVTRIERIRGLTHVPYPDRDDGFSTIALNGKEIGHFHHFNELDLKLGKKLIKREGLTHYPDSENHPNRSPNSQFIELRFHQKSDLNKIIELIELLVADQSK